MEYNFNYKLKFQVPQPSSAPPKLGACARCPSGVHAVHVWLTHSARGVRLARSRCASGSHVCARSARLACSQCASSSSVVRVWLAHGARAVRVWPARGARLALPRSTRGACLARPRPPHMAPRV